MVMIGRAFGRQRIPDKRRELREAEGDDDLRSFLRQLDDVLGDGPLVNAAERAMLNDRRFADLPYDGPDKREYIDE